MNLHSPISETCCTTVGGASTLTIAVQLAVRPRLSVTVAVVVMELPGEALAVSRVALGPDPLIEPAVVAYA